MEWGTCDAETLLAVPNALSEAGFAVGKLYTSKRKRAANWVVSMAVEEQEDVDHLPFADVETEVYCLSQIPRKLIDPLVKDRDCILADPGGVRPWKGSLLPSFMKEMTTELKQHIGELQEMSLMSSVVFEAYKLLEEDFSLSMQSVLGMREHQKFVKKFRRPIAEAAKEQASSCSLASSWIEQKIPFGGFVHALLLMLDTAYSTESKKLQGEALLSQGLEVFQGILEDVLKDLQDEYTMCTVPSPLVEDSLAFMKEPANMKAMVREFATCTNLRSIGNGYSHPFSPIASKAVRETAMNMYSALLSDDFTKDFRHVVVLGKVKLELLEFSKKEEKNIDKVGDRFLSSDSGGDTSDYDVDDDLSPKVSGLWED